MKGTIVSGLCPGNFVKTEYGYIGIFETVNLAKQTVFVRIEDKLFEKYPEEIEGVEITKNWMNTTGFITRISKSNYETMIGNQQLFLQFSEDNTLSATCIDSCSRHANLSLRNFKLKYIHELQNMYFLRFKKILEFDEKLLEKLITFENHMADLRLMQIDLETRRPENQEWIYNKENEFRGFDDL